MGDVIHKVVVVTTWRKDVAEALHAVAGPTATAIQRSPINGFRSFAVLTSGSKRGWYADDEHRGHIETLVRAIEACRYDDGSSPVEWFEVWYGGDAARVCRDGRGDA